MSGDRMAARRSLSAGILIGLLSGISKTDWSWSALMADFDNNGWKDICITNGIKKDVRNNDFHQRILSLTRRHVKTLINSIVRHILLQ